MELLEIERDLNGPDKEAAMAKYDAVLVGLYDRLQESMRVGLAPDDFEKCKPLAEAIIIARKLLRIQIRSEKRGLE